MQVSLLLGKLLLELQQLLLLTLADGVVLGGTLTSLEGVAGKRALAIASLISRILEVCCLREIMGPQGRGETHAWPVLGGAPVSPSAMVRAETVKVRMGVASAGRVSLLLLRKDWRSIFAASFGCMGYAGGFEGKSGERLDPVAIRGRRRSWGGNNLETFVS